MVDLANMETVEKECGALGGLFQAIVNDMKVEEMTPPPPLICAHYSVHVLYGMRILVDMEPVAWRLMNVAHPGFYAEI